MKRKNSKEEKHNRKYWRAMRVILQMDPYRGPSITTSAIIGLLKQGPLAFKLPQQKKSG